MNCTSTKKTFRYFLEKSFKIQVLYHKMEELKQEAGKISNVDLKKSIVRVFYYLCVVSTYFLVLFIVKQHLNQAFSAACDFPIPDFWFQNWNFGDLGIH